MAVVQLPSSNSESSANLATAATDKTAKPLDTLSSTDVAVHIARLTKMDESTAVVNKADTASAQLALSSADDQVLSKPQIVNTTLKSKKDIKSYTVVEGETVTSVAAKFGVTPDTIRFSNGITGDAIPAGKTITISPVNGMTYVVKDGDNPDTLASKYNVPKAQLVAFNDAEISNSFKTGETIVIPDAIQPAAVRTASYGIGTRASASSPAAAGSSFSFGAGALYGGNGYDYGWCTWHAANRRIQAGKPLPTNLGNAISWVPLAKRAGLATGSTPEVGAVFSQRGTGSLGHVGYVEKVNDDGSFMASDMNYPTWGKVTYRTVSASEVGSYTFIY